jgi:hypothetical protein
METFIKHCESIMTDYESDSFLIVNLLGQNQPHEEALTNLMRKLLEDTYTDIAKKGKKGENRKIDYDYFDFHA